MRFVPISIPKYVPMYLKANPSSDPLDIRRRLEGALAASRAGERCQCGNPIWVIGSADAGQACFTCITGESVPDGDYEIDEAISRS